MHTRTELAAIWPPSAEAAREAGHGQQSPLRAIRKKCIDCSGDNLAEARSCEAVSCPLWPFRAGRHPWYGLSGETPSDPPVLAQGGPIGVPPRPASDDPRPQRGLS
jgi:hypothetical protein